MSEEKATYLGETPEDNHYEIREEAPHDFFCQIPNLVDELNLSPYAYRLYGHLKRVAGESGKCWKSTKTLSKACRMSMGSVSEAKQELENTYPPLIRVMSKKGDNGMYHEIVITDIWQINHDYWRGEVVHIVKSPPKPSHGETPPSHGETKKNTIKKTPVRGTVVPAGAGLDWQIAAGQELSPQDQFIAQARDAANLMDMGCLGASELAYAFMTARKILIPEGKIKGNRKAAREMLEMGVKAEHITRATLDLMAKGMTVTDLFSVSKTAIDMANKLEPVKEYTRLL